MAVIIIATGCRWRTGWRRRLLHGRRARIHFVAATPRVRAFVGYHPTLRDNPTTELRPVPPWEDVKKFNCPSTVLYDRDDVVTAVPVQDKGWKSFPVNGQSLE